MSKSELSTTAIVGASASQSKSIQKVLDIERRFIDDFMTLSSGPLHSLLKAGGMWLLI